MSRVAIVACVIVGALVGVAMPTAGEEPERAAEKTAFHGLLKPVGPPTRPPRRTDAGGDCVVDLVQTYELSGALSGAATIDYRILVEGPCGSPPGTFAERWIAHGEFTGRIGSSEATTHFAYVAEVAAGGEVNGKIHVGPEREGELQVRGRFSDRQLSYSGWVR